MDSWKNGMKWYREKNTEKSPKKMANTEKTYNENTETMKQPQTKIAAADTTR